MMHDEVHIDSIEKNVFPLFARFDQFIEYDVQKKCYDEEEDEDEDDDEGEEVVAVMEKDHLTGALASTELRNHFLAHTA